MPKFKRKQKIAIKLTNKFREFYRSQIMCDFAIYAGNECLMCHKVILAAASPWFEDWFKLDPKCSSLKMPNFTFEQIKAIVDFVYIGKFILAKKSDLNQLFAKAKLIQIEINNKMLVELQNENCNTENAAEGSSTVPTRPNSAELMPPPPSPSLNSASQAVRVSRFDDVFFNEMDEHLPFSQVMETNRNTGNGHSDLEVRANDSNNDEDMGDEFLPFSQVVPAPVKIPSPGQSKTPFKCDVSGCKHRFGKKRELANHKHKYHEKKNFRCPVSACKKKFERGKMFSDHMAEKHPDYVRERYKHINSQKSSTSNSTAASAEGTPDNGIEVLKVLKVEFDENSQDIFKC